MSVKMSLLATAVLLAGCSTTSTPVIDHTSLFERQFILSQVDGQPASAQQRTPQIAFDKTLRVSGMVCNRFFGQGKLSGGKLQVPQLASTKMLCSDGQLNQWENTLSTMLMNGATIGLDKQTLTLKGDGHTFVYTEIPQKKN